MNAKQQAAEKALELIESGMVVGLGTGSTADCFLVALGGSISARRLRDIRGIPTSRRSEQRARELGIPLVSFRDGVRPNVTVDGADEIAPNLDLIKGLGGALLREKIVAQNSGKLIVIADGSKMVGYLGQRAALPVEVTPFGHELQPEFLAGLGCTPTLRRGPDGNAFVTDNSNFIYDCRFSGSFDPKIVQAALFDRAGVVESGLFVGMAKLALVAQDDGSVVHLTPGQ